MSADNGIYILRTKARPVQVQAGHYTNQHGKFEYRVTECSAIDNLDYCDLYMPALFGDSEVFSEEEKAFERAKKIEEKIEQDGWFTEYGINLIKKDIVFPAMSSYAANLALTSFVYPDEQIRKGDLKEYYELHKTTGLVPCLKTDYGDHKFNKAAKAINDAMCVIAHYESVMQQIAE